MGLLLLVFHLLFFVVRRIVFPGSFLLFIFSGECKSKKARAGK